MHLNLNKIQQFYFDQIKNDHLKKLISGSYSVMTMNDTDKLDILIAASIAHNDAKAEQNFIRMFEAESKEIDEAVDSAPAMAPEEASKQAEIIKDESARLTQNIGIIRRALRTQKEEKEQSTEKQTAEQLLNQLNNA